MPAVRPVAILGGVRIPFCRQNTAYADVGNLGMSVRTLGALVERFGLHGQQLGEVAMGAVIKHPSDWNLAREATLSSGLSPLTPGLTLQRACGTSLDALVTVANKIALGQIEAGIGGGSDTTSDVPIVYGKSLRARLLAANRAKSMKERIAAFKGFRLSELKPEFPGVAEPRTGKSMGQHCEDMAREWNVSRDSQDEWAVSSHRKLAAAYERGFFADLVVPFRGVERDNILRPDSSLEKLATLKPAFDKASGRGTLTAANSTPLTDGAAAALLASDEWARAHGHAPLAWLRDAQVAAVDFVHGEGLLMAPTVAVAEMLGRNGLTLQDFDIYEIHEAFAAQVLCTLRAWESEDYCRQRLGLDAPLGRIDPEKINPVGSSLATGHPFAATGARIVATVAKQLAERGGGRALVSICTAGGMGVVAIVER
ncbi:MAG: acetyl-CoA C-acetyltransferase [Pseudoxanthomonas sp.]|nr:acetyl-CoA C-acetyltransferase [Pseudoxanthomonas sp.]MBP8804303.1 acetyl-CoA C-acetyltransferase [Pseudoxanthomonas sp.]MBP9534682.1 acetyl-CoA C-acetyltransferase [Pseudoxanthomonas sp.]MDZ3798538.1 acetyl-CoA C-acetyltransferase [Xanthomonadales bacterium]